MGCHFLPFGDEPLDLVVKIGKRRADALPVLLESSDSLDCRADRAMKNNIGRDEYFERRDAPGIPDFGVLAARG